MTLAEMFQAAEEHFLQFDLIENPRHPAPDICAFLMLYDLVPTIGRGSGQPVGMVDCAEHDEIYLATDCEKLAAVVTPEIVRDLHRCGVRYSEEYNSLCMFV